MSSKDLNEFDWKYYQKLHDNGMYIIDLINEMSISRTLLNRAIKEGFFKKSKIKRRVSNETKKKISDGRKKYLKENPDKHPWKRSSKFKSKPCEILKSKLINDKILFIEEYQPSDDKFYCIDIAFPNKKIGVEVNGNQHYMRNGELKKYYLERNNFFKSIGWEMFDIHYSLIYNDKLINSFIKSLKEFTLTRDELDEHTLKYFKRLEDRRDNSKKCDDCGQPIKSNYKRCRKCDSMVRRKVERPSYEQLLKEIEETNYSAVGRKYGVSDTSIRKWIKQYEKMGQ